MKILLIGMFRKDAPQAGGGEVTKPRNVFRYFDSHKVPNCVFDCFDFYPFRKRPLRLFFLLFRKLKGYDACYIFPSGPHGLLFFCAFFHVFFSKKDIPVFYPVVGGWIGKYLSCHPHQASVVKKFEGCYCETRGLCDQLVKNGFNNIFYSPVFSDKRPLDLLTFASATQHVASLPYLSFFTFSRVTEEKGILLAIEAITNYNLHKDSALPEAKLDIYGHLDFQFKNELLTAISCHTTTVSFVGTLPDSELIKTLSSHLACLFPTYFYGEGFPASILECYIAGVPVFASDWLYNSELIDQQKTGGLFKVRDASDIEKTILWVANNRKLVLDMRGSCLQKSMFFSEDICMKPLVDSLNHLLSRQVNS
jgi:glycosyltransferase involved in cell wall biosynthesis